MPVITVNVLKQSDVGKKRKLVERLTAAIVDAYGVPKEAVIVQIKEDEPENVGRGGALLLDEQRKAGR